MLDERIDDGLRCGGFQTSTSSAIAQQRSQCRQTLPPPTDGIAPVSTRSPRLRTVSPAFRWR